MKRTLLLVVTLVCFCSCSDFLGTVYYDADSQQYTFKAGIMDPQGVAWANHSDATAQTGWSVLHLTTTENLSQYSDDVIAYAAGYVEGVCASFPCKVHLTVVYRALQTIVNQLESSS